jgi:hypothetical protein
MPVRIEVTGNNAAEVLDNLESLIALLRKAGVSEDEVVASGPLEEVISNVVPQDTPFMKAVSKRGRKAKAEEPAPEETTDEAEAAPALSGSEALAEGLGLIRQHYDDVPLRAKFRPLLTEFNASAFGEIKPQQGGDFLTAVKRVLAENGK